MCALIYSKQLFTISGLGWFKKKLHRNSPERPSPFFYPNELNRFCLCIRCEESARARGRISFIINKPQGTFCMGTLRLGFGMREMSFPAVVSVGRVNGADENLYTMVKCVLAL